MNKRAGFLFSLSSGGKGSLLRTEDWNKPSQEREPTSDLGSWPPCRSAAPFLAVFSGFWRGIKCRKCRKRAVWGGCLCGQKCWHGLLTLPEWLQAACFCSGRQGAERRHSSTKRKWQETRNGCPGGDFYTPWGIIEQSGIWRDACMQMFDSPYWANREIKVTPTSFFFIYFFYL